jgi:hypothetical protein
MTKKDLYKKFLNYIQKAGKAMEEYNEIRLELAEALEKGQESAVKEVQEAFNNVDGLRDKAQEALDTLLEQLPEGDACFDVLSIKKNIYAQHHFAPGPQFDPDKHNYLIPVLMEMNLENKRSILLAPNTRAKVEQPVNNFNEGQER